MGGEESGEDRERREIVPLSVTVMAIDMFWKLEKQKVILKGCKRRRADDKPAVRAQAKSKAREKKRSYHWEPPPWWSAQGADATCQSQQVRGF